MRDRKRRLVSGYRRGGVNFVSVGPLTNNTVRGKALTLHCIYSGGGIAVIVPKVTRRGRVRRGVGTYLSSSPLDRGRLRRIRAMQGRLNAGFYHEYGCYTPYDIKVSVSNIFLFTNCLGHCKLKS